jgi:hemerythrin superfamily protein
MNAIQFLISEYNKVRAALAKIANHTNSFEKKRKLFKKLSHGIIIHETVEEKKWYHHFKDKLDSRVDHLISEEKHAANEIEKLDHIHDENTWDERFSRFRKAVENHAKEEEEKLFPQVIKILNPEQLEKIGQELLEYKNQLISEYANTA